MLRTFRRFFPSASRMTFNTPAKLLLDAADLPARLFYPEFRRLPPNHMRVRVGTGGRYLANQVFHLQEPRNFWLFAFSRGLVRLDHTILDIGVGCGRFAAHIRDYVQGPSRFTGSYIGVDIDAEMLAWCRQAFPPDHFRFHLSTDASASYNRTAQAPGPYRVPEPDGSVDFVMATSLFTHLLEAELDNYLREAARLLRPGGHLAAQFFCLDHPPPTYGGRHTFSHRVGNAHVESLAQPEAAVAYREAFLFERVRAAGLADPELMTGGGGWQPLLLCRKP
ncbi:MAG TPA: class I SAM-dependent methyltransferase [Azospirillaceae bacterium]|nr:class I SAM-dependent methyltransferase [Azospirillaceae bacterium]